MKKLLLATLILFLGASTCTQPASAQNDSWPEYSLGSTLHPFGIGILQRLLNERGYRVKMDSAFGVQTRNALIRFQKARGLKPTGTSTRATWQKLIVRSKRGSKGQAVRAIQEMLSLVGFSTIEDGVFGSGTERVVKRFQKARDLTPDGIVGPQTWSALVMESAMKYE